MTVAALTGRVGYLGGSSGTAQVPSGAYVLSIIAHSSAAGASMVLFGGASVPVNSGQLLQLYFSHSLWQAQGPTNTTSTNIVFTNTDSYWVEYVQPQN